MLLLRPEMQVFHCNPGGVRPRFTDGAYRGDQVLLLVRGTVGAQNDVEELHDILDGQQPPAVPIHSLGVSGCRSSQRAPSVSTQPTRSAVYLAF